jgi:cytochrome c-type biogenesis protein CcmH/NrfF
LFAWVVPPFAFLVGLLLVVVALRHFRARRETEPHEVRTLSEEDESVLAKALQEQKAAEEFPF